MWLHFFSKLRGMKTLQISLALFGNFSQFFIEYFLFLSNTLRQLHFYRNDHVALFSRVQLIKTLTIYLDLLFILSSRRNLHLLLLLVYVCDLNLAPQNRVYYRDLFLNQAINPLPSELWVSSHVNLHVQITVHVAFALELEGCTIVDASWDRNLLLAL